MLCNIEYTKAVCIPSHISGVFYLYKEQIYFLGLGLFYLNAARGSSKCVEFVMNILGEQNRS